PIRRWQQRRPRVTREVVCAHELTWPSAPAWRTRFGGRAGHDKGTIVHPTDWRCQRLSLFSRAEQRAVRSVAPVRASPSGMIECQALDAGVIEAVHDEVVERGRQEDVPAWAGKGDVGWAAEGLAAPVLGEQVPAPGLQVKDINGVGPMTRDP